MSESHGRSHSDLSNNVQITRPESLMCKLYGRNHQCVSRVTWPESQYFINLCVDHMAIHLSGIAFIPGSRPWSGQQVTCRGHHEARQRKRERRGQRLVISHCFCTVVELSYDFPILYIWRRGQRNTNLWETHLIALNPEWK